MHSFSLEIKNEIKNQTIINK